jgi:hypothetical protein
MSPNYMNLYGVVTSINPNPPHGEGFDGRLTKTGSASGLWAGLPWPVLGWPQSLCKQAKLRPHTGPGIPAGTGSIIPSCF